MRSLESISQFQRLSDRMNQFNLRYRPRQQQLDLVLFPDRASQSWVSTKISNMSFSQFVSISIEEATTGGVRCVRYDCFALARTTRCLLKKRGEESKPKRIGQFRACTCGPGKWDFRRGSRLSDSLLEQRDGLKKGALGYVCESGLQASAVKILLSSNANK